MRAVVLAGALVALNGCAAIEPVVGIGSSLFAAWKAHQAEAAVRDSVPCAALERLEPSEATVAAAPREDLEAMVGHNRVLEKLCPPPAEEGE